MKGIRRPVRIDPAFDNRGAVRALFDRTAPFASAATYLPDGSDETTPRPTDAVLPWFRGTWALGGAAQVPDAESILHNSRFVAAAGAFFEGAQIVPKTVVVNVNAPMPAGIPHVDVPAFHGATRETLPLRLLIAMGAFGLFEPWRIIEAGIISWFYDGEGGTFDYWPDGLAGPMACEAPPFGNVALLADSDRMYHRIGAVGRPTTLPRMTAAALIRPTGETWTIEEAGEVRAVYPGHAVRLSVLWKAEVFWDDRPAAPLTTAQIVDALDTELRRRGDLDGERAAVDNPAWVARVYRAHLRP